MMFSFGTILVLSVELFRVFKFTSLLNTPAGFGRGATACRAPSLLVLSVWFVVCLIGCLFPCGVYRGCIFSFLQFCAWWKREAVEGSGLASIRARILSRALRRRLLKGSPLREEPGAFQVYGRALLSSRHMKPVCVRVRLCACAAGASTTRTKAWLLMCAWHGQCRSRCRRRRRIACTHSRSFGDYMTETAYEYGFPNAFMCFLFVCHPCCVRPLSLINAAPFQGLAECSLPMPSRLSPESEKVAAPTRIAKVRSRGGHFCLQHLFFQARGEVWGGGGRRDDFQLVE